MAKDQMGCGDQHIPQVYTFPPSFVGKEEDVFLIRTKPTSDQIIGSNQEHKHDQEIAKEQQRQQQRSISPQMGQSSPIHCSNSIIIQNTGIEQPPDQQHSKQQQQQSNKIYISKFTFDFKNSVDQSYKPLKDLSEPLQLTGVNSKPLRVHFKQSIQLMQREQPNSPKVYLRRAPQRFHIPIVHETEDYNEKK